MAVLYLTFLLSLASMPSAMNGETIASVADILGGSFTAATSVTISDVTLTTVTRELLEMLPAVHALTFRNNANLESFDQDTFLPVRNIRQLSVETTNKLNIFPNISNLIHLEIVTIERSMISDIPESNILNLPSLEKLDLRYNKFASTPVSIGSLFNLEELFLDINEISKVNLSNLRNSTKLRFLSLSRNFITALPALSLLPALERLDLSGNRIPALPWDLANSPETEVDTLKITYLRFSYSQIPINVSSDFSFFERTPELSTLIMENCQLSGIPSTVRFATNLKQMNFKKNLITEFPAAIAEKLINLDHIYLSDNQLTSLPVDALKLMSKLVTLDVQNNQLKSLGDVPSVAWMQPLVIDLTGNPLVCDASWCWVRRLEETAAPLVTVTLGEFPCTNINVSSFQDIHSKDLGCYDHLKIITEGAAVFDRMAGHSNHGNLYTRSTLDVHGGSVVQNTTYTDSPSCVLGCFMYGPQCAGYAIDTSLSQCWLLVT